MLRQLLFFFLLYSSCASIPKGSTPISSGVIHYKTVLIPNEEGEAMQEAFSAGATVYFNKDYLKLIKKETGPGDEFTITDLKSGEESTYLEVKDRRFAVLFDKKYLPTIGALQLTNEFKTIAGHSCQKAVAKMGDGHFFAYLSKEISVNYCPYLDVEGFALEYSFAMPFGQLTYTAEKVVAEEVPSQAILPKEIFEPITVDDFNQEMMTIMGGGPSNGLAPDFAKSTLNGETISRSSLKGSVVVLNFWFTTCAPCKAEIPYLNELKNEMADENVQFVAITFESKSSIETFIKNNPFDFKMVSDAGDVINDYEVSVFPTTLILDKNGNIAHRKMGGGSNIKAVLKPLIEEVLNQE